MNDELGEIEKYIGMRHGPYGYNGSLPDKIRKVADREVSVTMEKVVPRLNPQAPVIIITSSLLRAIFTGEKVGEVLQGTGFEVGRAIVEPQLDEVIEFSWSIFIALMEGGNMKFDGKIFQINKAETNPKGLGYPEYFIVDQISKIPEAERKNWPRGFRFKVERMETYISVQKRFASLLESLPRKRQIILITHDGVLLGSVMAFTGRKRGLQPAGFIEFGSRANGLVVERVCDSNGEIATGNSSINIIDFLKNAYVT